MIKSQVEKRGNLIARDVWTFLQQQKRVQLVPWVTDPASPQYDPIEAARMEGYREALNLVEELMVRKAAELLADVATQDSIRPEPPPDRDPNIP